MISTTTRSTAVLRLALCLVLCLACVGAGVGTDVTAAQQPTTIDVSVGGERLVDGTEQVVLTDPTANVSVASNATIELVEIRVDGEIRHTYRPETDPFEQAVSLDLDPEENTIEVVVKSADVTTFEAIITKHTAAPRVRYTSPFSTSILGGPDNETTVSSGQVQLAGELHTVSSVSHIRIERTHIAGNATNQTDCRSQPDCSTDRTLHRINDPGDSFTQNLLLGVGKNEIVARYTDENGRTNVDSFRLVVDDATDPVVSLDVPNKSYTKSVRIRGTVRDETKLHRVAINRTSNNASQVLLASSDPEPDPDRLSDTFDTTVNLYDNNENNEFRLVVEDSAGNIQERLFSVDYNPTPRVSITKNATNATAKTVHVTGNISEAQIKRVTLETIDTRSGDRLDLARVYGVDAPTTSAVELNHTLTAVPGETVITLLITYEHGQYSKTITPVVSALPESTNERATTTADESASDTNAEEEPTSNETDSGVVSATSGNDDSPTNGGNSLGETPVPTLIPIHPREALGGVIIVGAIYLLGHRV